MKTARFPGGESVPALGLGTWRMGESRHTHAAEIAAVRRAIELGYRLFDTAEMYGEGGAESMLGEALRGAISAGDVERDDLFVVSKVYPHNAGRKAAVAACERSLRRLGLDTIDLYLLHWRSEYALPETVGAFETLQTNNRIRYWGVSNFNLDDMQELWGVDGGKHCATNQVWYSPGRRGADFELLPWMRKHSVPAMAYSPIDRSALAKHVELASIGKRLNASAAQIALAWVLREPGVIAIPKAVQSANLKDNFEAQAIELDTDTLRSIDRTFPPPQRSTPLAVN